MEENKNFSPWLNARKTHNDRLLQALLTAKTMNLFSTLAFLVSLVAVGGVIYVGSQSKIVPIVYEIDKYHNILSSVKASQVAEAKPVEYEIASANFIRNLRNVTADYELQRTASNSAFAYVLPKSPAQQKVIDYLGMSTDEKNPFNRSKDELVNVEDVSVIKTSAKSYQVDWTETVRLTGNGEVKETSKMQAVLTFKEFDRSAVDSMTDEVRFSNPYLIFIEDFTFNRIK